MASIRTIDFAIILVGHNHQQNGDFHEAPEAGFDIDTAAYEAAKRGRPEARTLVRVIGHAGDDIDSHKNQLMTFIRGKTNGNLNTIGSFCAIGTSNSCSTVLALAAELKGSGAPRLSYVGVIDVTFIPYGVGRQPPLPNGLGGLKPYNPPDKNAISNLELANPVNLVPYIHPNVRGGEPPRITFDQSLIDTKRRRNFYQTEGNHAKLVHNAPNGQKWTWWWASLMKNDEVHGAIDGWENEPFKTRALSDQGRHEYICGRQDSGWGAMCREAATALAQLPD